MDSLSDSASLELSLIGLLSVLAQNIKDAPHLGISGIRSAAGKVCFSEHSNGSPQSSGSGGPGLGHMAHLKTM